MAPSAVAPEAFSSPPDLPGGCKSFSGEERSKWASFGRRRALWGYALLIALVLAEVLISGKHGKGRRFFCIALSLNFLVALLLRVSGKLSLRLWRQLFCGTFFLLEMLALRGVCRFLNTNYNNCKDIESNYCETVFVENANQGQCGAFKWLLCTWLAPQASWPRSVTAKLMAD